MLKSPLRAVCSVPVFQTLLAAYWRFLYDDAWGLQRYLKYFDDHLSQGWKSFFKQIIRNKRS